jgi:predicted RNase H-like nuclease (RuvC/YqgF family)
MTGEEVLCKQLDEIMALVKVKNEKIASLESQLREKDERIKQYNKMLDPILDWGQSPESGLKLGQSITKEVLRMAKESKGKDQEIQALKEVLKQFLHVYDVGDTDTDVYNLVESCRKLIWD